MSDDGKCAGGCGFYGSAATENYCSVCWKKKNGEELDPYLFSGVSGDGELSAEARAQGRTHALHFVAQRGVNHYLDVVPLMDWLKSEENRETIENPLDLWNILENNTHGLSDRKERLYLMSEDGCKIMKYFDNRENNWLYHHVVACRIADGWNIADPDGEDSYPWQNTVGYNDYSQNAAHVPESIEAIAAHIEQRSNFSKSQVESFGS